LKTVQSTDNISAADNSNIVEVVELVEVGVLDSTDEVSVPDNGNIVKLVAVGVWVSGNGAVGGGDWGGNVLDNWAGNTISMAF